MQRTPLSRMIFSNSFDVGLLQPRGGGGSLTPQDIGQNPPPFTSTCLVPVLFFSHRRNTGIPYNHEEATVHTGMKVHQNAFIYKNITDNALPFFGS